MDYNKIVQGILDIGEAMLQSGAENFRLEDSFYRMCRSYGFKRSDVFVIPSNIQVTVETPEGEIITQIRHIESSEPNFDQLDYLNNLCRYVCQHTPDEKEMREKYLEVINREPQKRITRYAAGIMGGTGFAVFFGCNVWDAIVALIVSVMIVAVGDWLAKRESNLMVYNAILSFISEVIIIVALKMGVAGIAFGIGLAIMLFHEGYSDHFILNHSVPIQLISCTVACTGFAFWFKIRGKQVWYNSIGAFFTWAIYVVVFALKPSNFLATMIAAVFVAFYAFIMSRVNKAPSTIFLTASVFPLIPGPNLYYVMYGCVSQDPQLAFDETIVLMATCLAIAFGFIIVDVASRSIMYALKREYHIGKSALNLPLIGGKK